MTAILVSIAGLVNIAAFLVAIALDVRHGLSYQGSWGWWSLGDFTGAAYWLGHHVWWVAAVLTAVGVYTLRRWWRNRRNRKRRKVAALLGAKSRALRDALVRKAREAAKPKPVLRPVPGGAR